MSAKLRELIRANGPITFARFMEVALYEEGFYSRPPIGVAGHYVTSPHVSSCFADLLGRQLDECRRVLGSLTVVEAGAGDGTLASQLLASSAPGIRYVAVERSPGARAALSSRGIESFTSLRDLSAVTGVIFANELLDNVPFHRLRRRGGRIVEVLVGLDGDEFVEVEGEASPDVVAAAGGDVPEAAERPASPGWRAWVREAAEALERGWIILFDYGFSGDVPSQSVRGYAEHRITEDVLSDPGSRDISTGVDFDALVDEGRSCGLDVWGPVSQREALFALAYRAWMGGLRKRQAQAEGAGNHRDAVRLFAEQTRAPLLVDPAHLGGHQVLVFGRGVPAPRLVGKK